MGPIQSSLNRLVLSAIGTVAGGIKLAKSGEQEAEEKTQAQKEKESQKQPAEKSETKSAMGNIAKIGRNYSRSNIRSYEAAARSVEAGNEEIDSKAKSHFSPITARLEEVNAAIASFTKDGEEDKE